MKNIIKSKLESGETVIGSIVSVNSPDIVEVLALAGFDFIFIDNEHGPLNIETTANLIRAAEARACTPIVRVPENDPIIILKTLDIGAFGIHVPQINSREDATEMVKAAKYYPLGERGTAFPRSSGYGLYARDKNIKETNSETLLIPHIENIKGVENLKEILATTGLDIVFIGPYDLSQSLGIPGQLTHPLLEEKITYSLAMIKAAGLIAGIFASSVEDAQQRIKQGFRYILYSMDTIMLSKIARSELSQLKK
ncbi:MAG: 4-hydroxy-2-oxovalerate aldolase [Peptococcaceae bacterium BICA1-8]|nr:MAG: 4-hydroxy-2-oxovalerate aldolase [Peptococcaceae bacterium BICA1-8]